MSWSTFPFVLTSEHVTYAFRNAGGRSPGNTSAYLFRSLSLSPSVLSLSAWGRRKWSPVHPQLHGPPRLSTLRFTQWKQRMFLWFKCRFPSTQQNIFLSSNFFKAKISKYPKNKIWEAKLCKKDLSTTYVFKFLFLFLMASLEHFGQCK